MVAIGGSTSVGASWRGAWVKERLDFWFNMSHEIVCRVPSLDLVILCPASSTETNKRAACQQYTEGNYNCGADYLWKHTHANFCNSLNVRNWFYRVGSVSVIPLMLLPAVCCKRMKGQWCQTFSLQKWATRLLLRLEPCWYEEAGALDETTCSWSQTGLV